MTSRASSGGDGPDPDRSAAVDTVFRVLSAAERRYVLYYLRERGSAPVDELATVLAGWLGAREDAAAVVTADERDRLRAVLHHVHLPTLAAAGIVSYDLDSGEVELTPLPEFLDAVVERSLAVDRERFGDRSTSADNRWS